MSNSLGKALFCLILVICMLPANRLMGQRHFHTHNRGQVTFISEAPQETIHARSNRLKGVVDWEKGTFLFTIDIKSFTGFNTPVQREHFNENYMESDTYPVASFQGKFVEAISPDKSQTLTVRAKGKMKIHGVERQMIIPLELKIKKTEVVAKARFIIALEDFEIKIPRIVSEKLSPNILVLVSTSLTEMQ